MIVNGAYRGLRAIMERLNEKSFSVTVRIDQVRRGEREGESEVCVCLCVCRERDPRKRLTVAHNVVRVQPEVVLLIKSHMKMFANLHRPMH